MKYRFFVFCLLALPFWGWGQGFELLYGDTNVYNHPIKTIELPNEDAYLVLYQFFTGQFGAPFHLRINKVDNNGNILWEKQHDLPAEEQFSNLSYAALPTGFMLVNTVYVDYFYYQLEFKEFDFEGELVNEAYYPISSSLDLEKIMLMPDHSVVSLLRDYLNDNTHIIKVSKEGNLLWTKIYAESIFNAFLCKALRSTSNGDIIAIGQIYSPFQIDVITKFDQAGNLLWQTQLPIDFTDDSYILPSYNENAYLLYGEGNSFNSTFIAKVDSNGVFNWSQNFSSHIGSFHWQNGNYAVPSENNTFYLAGDILDGNILRNCLVQIGDDGSIIWEKRYGELGTSYTQQLLRTNDGGLLISAQYFHSQSSSLDPHLLKTNSIGELEWSWTTLRNHFNYLHKDVIITSDNNYLEIGSYTIPSGQGSQNYLIKLDSNGVVYTNMISGHLIFDENLSCGYDNGEPSLANWMVMSNGIQTTYATTLSDGSFWLPTNSDSAVVTMLPPNDCWNSCPEPVYALFNMPFDTTEVELKAQAVKDCPILQVDVSVPFLRRCQPNTYTILCKNTGTIPSENTQMKVYLDPYFEFISSSAPLTSQNGIELIFDIGTIGVNEQFSFTVTIKVSCDSELGQEHCLSVNAEADNLCLIGVDNTLAQTRECQPNIGSFDPNDKRAFSLGTLTNRFIPADSIIEYQIRFQNTGTDTAFNVVITDTLSNLLNIESLIAGASSHPYRLELEQNNIVKFVFNDIMLPDSNVNEPGSHGFVKFRIRHKAGLVPGDVIPNKAAIYFDFNDAVITNNLELEIESPPSATKPPRAQEDLLKIYPQPAGNVVYFELKNDGNGQPFLLEVFNLLGQPIQRQSVKEGVNTVIDLPAGQHYFRLWRNDELMQTGKVVVVK